MSTEPMSRHRHLFRGRPRIRRWSGFAVATGMALVCLVQIAARSADLALLGASYPEVQLAGEAIGVIPAICCPDPSGTFTAAIVWDIAFSIAYGLAGCLLGGLLADWASWRTVAQEGRPPEVNRIPTMFVLGSWVVLLAALFDLFENAVLLAAARGWAAGGPWAVRFGEVK